MISAHSILLILFLLLPGLCKSQNKSDDFLIKVLAADGITSPEEIQNYRSFYDKIFVDIKDKIDPDDDGYDKNETLFELLQDNYLKRYTEHSRFNKLLDSSEFNCVTSVILYYLLSSDLGLDINLYQSPFHVYITAEEENGDEYIIELTDPVDGFDYEWDEDKYVEVLLRYKIITQEELNKKGTRAIYNEYIVKSYEINPDQLLSDYYSNLAVYSVTGKNYADACRLMKHALVLNPDSINSYKYSLIWSLRSVDLKNDVDSLSAFLLETIDTIPASDDFREYMISASEQGIYGNLEKNNFSTADSIYRKLCGVLPEEKLKDRDIQNMDILIRSEIVRSNAIRGNTDTAFTIASDLIDKYPDNNNIMDLYIAIGTDYLGKLAMTGDYDKMRLTAKSLVHRTPGVKSVQDKYAEVVVSEVMTSGMYISNSKKAKKLLLEVYEDVPDNYLLKRALASVYHQLAMAEIRNNRNYKKAVSLLKEGLKYDPDNYDLKHEMELTRDLIK